MSINEKVLKPIIETKYLTTENSWRYRSIIRTFYMQYQKIKYWMYKEEVMEELKLYPYFKEYSMDQLKNDLDALVEWGNLMPMQDTKKAKTVEEFKNKQFRYKLSEYSVEIERMTVKLENLFVEGASLEPSLLERIKEHLMRITTLLEADDSAVDLWWRDLNSDFIRLNQNYQDYIRDLYSIKAEEMMKTRDFMVFKDKFIAYLRDFVKGLQQNTYGIEEILMKLDEDMVTKLLKKVFQYRLTIPRIDNEAPLELQWESILGRWTNLKNWFLGTVNDVSEASKLFDMTNEIIRKITRYAAQIVESRNSAANRKEEYKKLCQMFLNTKAIEEAHNLSSLAFGIFQSRHFKGDIERKTESINSGVFDEDPMILTIKPRIRHYKEKNLRNSIPDNRQRKNQMLQRMIQLRQREEGIIKLYIKNNEICFENLPVIPAYVRNTLLAWLSKGISNKSLRGKTEVGTSYQVIKPKDDKRCILNCDDGQLEMPAYTIKFYDEK
ncbi:TIGR02677 family protein [Alkaliphilus serpentinus]|uniref:TIGR02677 family protein n=1 Tax=Alkaliphilus serpentinus TaxID=1482731 RepID=A0A833HPF9_9FIRM|nr:TIGR02677 family protein [Alkaliphilus serpentinus]KAB3529806.1 TIGR02677 family protein [Alkaliphilus serpentinus]